MGDEEAVFRPMADIVGFKAGLSVDFGEVPRFGGQSRFSLNIRDHSCGVVVL